MLFPSPEDLLDLGIEPGSPALQAFFTKVAQMVKNLPAVQEMWFHPLVRKIPWGRERLPTPEFLPGEVHGQRSLAGSLGLQ